MADFVNTADIIGDAATADIIIQKSAELTEFNDNRIIDLREGLLRGCANLERVNMPSLKTAERCNFAFASCAKLKTVDLGPIVKMNAFIFSWTNNLTALIIRNSDSVCVLDGAFRDNSLFKNGKSYIYVPKTMADGSDGVSAYKAATNWSTYADSIRAIEDYPDITGG